MSPTAKANMDEAHDECSAVFVQPLQEAWERCVGAVSDYVDVHGRFWRDVTEAHRARVEELRSCN